jgi:hypothetical protein
MPIMFDEVTADIAAPPATAEAAPPAAPAPANSTDARWELHATLALLHEREARLSVD